MILYYSINQFLKNAYSKTSVDVTLIFYYSISGTYNDVTSSIDRTNWKSTKLYSLHKITKFWRGNIW